MTIISRHRRIATGMVSVAAFVSLAKIAGALKETTIADLYGTGQVADTYAILFSSMAWAPTVVSSALMVVMVPYLLRLRIHDSYEQEAWFSRQLITLTAIGGALSILVCIVGYLGGRSDAAAYFHMPPSQLLPMALIIAAGVPAGALSARLMAQGSHVNSLLEGVPSIVILLMLVLFKSDRGVLFLSTGLGYLAYLAILMAASRTSIRVRLRNSAAFIPEPFWRPLLIVMAGQAILTSTNVVDQFFALHTGAGGNATLSYANRIIILGTSLGAVAISRAILPVLSGIDDPESRRRLAIQWASLMAVGGAAMSIVGWFAAPTVIHVVYQHGNFNANDAQNTATALRYGLLQLGPYFCGIVLAQLNASRKHYATFVKIGIIGLVTKLLANFLLVPRFGIEGILLSTCIMYAVIAGELARGLIFDNNIAEPVV